MASGLVRVTSILRRLSERLWAEMSGGVVAEDVLGAEVFGDLLEGGGEVFGVGDVKEFAAGVFGQSG